MGKTIRRFQDNHRHLGDDHFCARALWRRQFLDTTVGVAGAMATSPLWIPSFALASDRVATVAPRPDRDRVFAFWHSDPALWATACS
jgi:hypothetical protein